ncbi:MAG: hypothetical protein BWY79_01178 [Actinobacteria bacterium ADurb.Bin444]|nr:MAG: hypothetical protein BWY79_01178 [Actinobacteria bacterium ADurb.Bin444]
MSRLSAIPTNPRYSMALSRMALSSAWERGRPKMSSTMVPWVRQCRPTITFCKTVSELNIRMFWNVRPMPRRVSLYGLTPPTDRPWNMMVPAVGSYTPEMQLSMVDLPEPLGPITARISLSFTRMSTESTAVRPPKTLVSPLVSRIMRHHLPSSRSWLARVAHLRTRATQWKTVQASDTPCFVPSGDRAR